MDDIEKAIAEVDSGNVSAGLELLEKAESTAEDEDKFQMAELYHQWGHVEKAQSLIEELRSRYPDEEELDFLLAELWIDAGEEEQALDLLSNIDPEGENGPRAMLLLADIYAAQGLDEAAEHKLLEAKRSVPEEPVVTLALAEFYFSHGDYQKSIPHYEFLLQEGSEFAGRNLNLRLGEALSAGGQFEESLLYYEKGAHENADTDGLFGFGVTAYRLGETGKAIQALSDLKKKDPEYSKLYLYLVKSYLAEGAREEALQIAEEGLEVDSFNDELAYETGSAAMQDNRYVEAESYFKKALAANALHHEALKALAGLFLQQERDQEVMSLLEGIEDQEEQDPVFFWFLASAENREEQYEQAKGHYQLAYHGLTEDPVFLEEYGDFLLEEGQPRKAVSLFQKALSVDPSFTHLEEKITHFED